MLRNSSILVVENGAEDLELLTSILVAEGYRVRAANNGEAALASAAARAPHLILLAPRLPGISGFEVCQRLRAGDTTRSVPVVLVGAARLMHAEAERAAAEPLDFIAKPLQRDEVLARVRTHLEFGRLRRELEQRVAQKTAELQSVVEQLQTDTVRKRMELAARECEALTRLGSQAGRAYIFDWNPSAGGVRPSGDFNGFPAIRGDATSRSWTKCLQHVHEEDREGLIRSMVALTPERDACECEYRVTGANGVVGRMRASIRALFDSQGHFTGFDGIAADLTRTRQAGAALHESEAHLQELADAASMMICASGPDKLATYFNRAWLTFTGHTLEQELGNGWVTGVHPDDVDRCLASYSSSFDARRNCHVEYRLRRGDGEYRSMVCSGVPQFATDGTFAGYIAFVIDITDLKRAQEEAYDQQKLQSLRVLTGGIAHDFNNLLGGILAEAELAEAELADGSSPLEGIQRIKGVTARAAEIVRELMIYSGQDKATLEPMDVSKLVADMAELLRVLISKHGLLRTDLTNGLPKVLCNAAQLRQVVMNLILNASEALGEKGGTIYVTTSKTTASENWTTDRESKLAEGEYVRLTVADSGCGMEDEVRARIFEPFFTTKPTGHGLGMAVVEGIVRSHGGAITVESTPGRGTTFEILLPSARELAGIKKPASAADAASCESQTVLVVEDEDSLRVSVSKALRKRGLTVLSAADGQAGLDVFQARAGEITAVLLDLTLPGMTGLEVLREILRIKPSMRVVLTSAYDRASAVKTVMREQDGVAFLRKPYRLAELAQIILSGASTAARTSAEAGG